MAISGDFFRREDQQLGESPDLFAQPTSGGLRLTGIDFALDDDGFMAVIGPSAAGKSTLFRALLGEVGNVSGSVSFAGEAVTASGLPGSLVSFLPQDDHLPSDLRVGKRCGLPLSSGWPPT
jgi:ABC-type protease/lipase transport system fused ATPase/permease subunit